MFTIKNSSLMVRLARCQTCHFYKPTSLTKIPNVIQKL